METIQLDYEPVSRFDYNQISNYGFNFALLTDEGKIFHTPFMCKDYLQDMFWTEYTKTEGQVYGLAWKMGTINLEAETFRLALIDKSQNISETAENLEIFVNHFCKAQEIAPCKVYLTQSENAIVVEFSKEWTRNGPMLSAFTTIIRVAGLYDGGNPLEYLKELQAEGSFNGIPLKKYMAVEVKRLDRTLPKLAALLAGKRVEHQWSDISNIMYAHVTGILGFAGFPTVSVE